MKKNNIHYEFGVDLGEQGTTTLKDIGMMEPTKEYFNDLVIQYYDTKGSIGFFIDCYNIDACDYEKVLYKYEKPSKDILFKGMELIKEKNNIKIYSPINEAGEGLYLIVENNKIIGWENFYSHAIETLNNLCPNIFNITINTGTYKITSKYFDEEQFKQFKQMFDSLSEYGINSAFGFFAFLEHNAISEKNHYDKVKEG